MNNSQKSERLLSATATIATLCAIVAVGRAFTMR